jgi:hypothetical protein
MTIQEAADALVQRLQGAPWATAVGIGERDGAPCIYVYVKSPKSAPTSFLDDGWNGFPVEIKKMGPIRPLDRKLVT